MKARKFSGLVLALLLFTVMTAACGEENTPAPQSNTAAPASAAPTGPTAPPTATSTASPVPAQPTVTAVPVNSPPAPPSPTRAGVNLTIGPVPASPSAKPASGSPQAIRQTRWQEVISSDPLIKVDPTQSDKNLGSFITVKDSDIYGYPQLKEVLYIDMDGDGVEEAAIAMFSGGTAGNISFLVFKQTGERSRLVAWASGYKLGLEIRQGKLVASSALYGGWEPNCCPGGRLYQTYALKGNRLEVTGEQSEGYPEAQPATVEHFYQLIDQRKFEEAYKLLAPAYQAANPLARWTAGYATTLKVEVENAAKDPNADTVQVTFAATDSTSGGGKTIRKFSGTWKMTWSPALRSWLLGEPSIKELTSETKTTLNPAFQAIVASLKSKTRLPVYLPVYVAYADPALPLYVTIEKATGSAYAVEYGFAPDCRGASACHLGNVTVENVGVEAKTPAGTRVNLANNLVGYFVEATCGANCGDASLTWQQGSVRYTFTLKAGRADELIKMVNSALASGPL